ncbi:MAG: glycosyl hydrolase family 18 protein [Candidatus Omnitrophota bacterium]
MKIKIFLFSLAALLVLTFPVRTADQTSQKNYVFPEVWGYVMKGEETYLSNSMPFTDIGYFSAAINEQGALKKDIQRPDLKGEFDKPVRIHLVISAPWNKTILNFCLRPDFPLRNQLIADIIELSANFDGIQIDFESLNWEDKDSYLSFLQEIRDKLPKTKIFSVAVPARWWSTENPFDYAVIAGIADRVIVMAYDEHWRTGPPGPIASLDWCKKVLDFSRIHIPEEKLVMGLPLYGRSWQIETLAKALKHPETLQLCQEKRCSIKLTESGSPYFEYQDTVNISVHFEDLQSLTSKIDAYNQQKVKKVAFWRVGQEPKELWKILNNQPGN